MRRIIKPAGNGKPQPAVEDVKVSYFSFDKNDNISVVDSVVEVPLGCGQFAVACMMKGFLEYFNAPLGTEPTPEEKAWMEKVEATYKQWQRVVSGGTKPQLAQEQAQ